MTPTQLPEIPQRPLIGDLLYAARYYLGGRRGLWLLAGVALVAGAAFNWSWLVAVGIAPIFIAVLPCVAMCALGLCMNKMAGRSCSTDAARRQTTDASPDDASPATIEQKPRLISPPTDHANAAVAATLVDPQSQPLEQRRTTDA
jgi:hypothetical protein